MKTHAPLVLLTVGVGTLTAVIAQSPREQEPPMGQAVFVDDTIIRPYDPTPALVTRETRVDRPKYPATDIHAHWSIDLEPAVLLEAMDDLGVERAVNLSGGFGAGLDAMLDRFHAAAPGRLVVFANLDVSQIDAPTFGADVAAMLERAHAAPPA